MDEKKHGMNAQEMKEIFGVFSEKLPALLDSLTDAIYSKDASAKFGTAVSDFYKTLRESGMSDEQAFKLTEQYMSSLNLGGIIAKTVGKHREVDE